MAASRPGNLDRGWNDPPEFLYNTPKTTQATPTRKNVLNKRVAYPSDVNNSSVQDSQSTPPQGAVHDHGAPLALRQATGTPPPPKLATPPICDNQSTDRTETPPDRTNQSATNEDEAAPCLDKVYQRLSEIASNSSDRIVLKKLEVFRDAWNAGKLSDHVRRKMALLSSALKNGDHEEAHHIHLGLMLNYTNEVGQWMVAIKKLIKIVQNKSQTSAEGATEQQTTKEEVTEKPT